MATDSTLTAEQIEGFATALAAIEQGLFDVLYEHNIEGSALRLELQKAHDALARAGKILAKEPQ